MQQGKKNIVGFLSVSAGKNVTTDSATTFRNFLEADVLVRPFRFFFVGNRDLLVLGHFGPKRPRALGQILGLGKKHKKQISLIRGCFGGEIRTP